MNQVLVEKWDAVLNSGKVEPIVDEYRKKVTAQLLENEEKFLAEATTSLAGNVQNWDPVLIAMVRRMAPKLIAYDVCGVQPMTGPTGLVFAMRSRYTNVNGTEASMSEADTDFSGTGTHLGSDPFGSYTTGTGKATADGEADTWPAMTMTIEKTSVTAKTRQLRADYSLELAQDLKAIHGMDAETELNNILSTEIIQEINREVVRTVYTAGKAGAAFASTPGTFDVSADSDGRWSVERYKGLLYAIERDANVIATETRRGKGNFLICSADVASALVMAGMLDYTPALAANANLEVDVTGVTYAGQMGRYKVYVDPYISVDAYVVGYKGSNPYDSGLFYCPYVPLQLVKTTNPDTFAPALGFKTRYGIVSNPFTSLTSGQNVYYRKVKVTNLL
jgi:hypothetical protein